MKNIILLLALIAFVGCKEETPTEQKVNLDKKYTLEELENDPDWVEVTDIDTLDKTPCIWREVIEFGELVENLDELKVLYKESDEFDREYSSYCFKADSMNIDFSNRTLILYWIDRHPAEIERKIFRNDNLKQYIYAAGFTGLQGDLVNISFGEVITIPKLNEDYDFKFDTLDVKD